MTLTHFLDNFENSFKLIKSSLNNIDLIFFICLLLLRGNVLKRKRKTANLAVNIFILFNNYFNSFWNWFIGFISCKTSFNFKSTFFS